MPVLCTLRSTAVRANANPGNNWHENCTSQLDCCWNYTSAPTLARFTPLSVTKTTNRHKWIINPVMKMTLSCLKVAPWCAVPWHRARRVSVYPTRGCITCQKMFSLGMMIWFLTWIFFCYLSQRAVSWVHIKHYMKCCCHTYQHGQSSGMDTFLWIPVVLWILICHCVACTFFSIIAFVCFFPEFKCLSNKSSWAISDIFNMNSANIKEILMQIQNTDYH